MYQSLQSSLNIIDEWCQRNSMKPNPQKTKAMIISPSNNIYNILNSTGDHNLELHSQSIEFTEVEKLLGIQIDHKLCWKTQVEQVLKKCNSLLYLLLRIKHFLNIHMRKVFYNAYILPHLDYCCTIWGNCSEYLSNSIHKFQKRAARIILDKSYDTPSAGLFSELNWMKIQDRILFKKAIFVYKSVNNEFPEYLSNLLTPKTNTNLRSHTQQMLQIPKPRLEFFRKSFAYSGPKLWNQIPLNIRQSESVNSFKSTYLKWWNSGGQHTVSC